MHFCACNRNGKVTGVHQVRAGSQAIAISESTVARDAWIRFYRSANDVGLSDGIDGVIPPRFIRAIRLLPSYDLFGTNEDRQWKVPDPIADKNPPQVFGNGNGEDAVTTKLTPGPDIGSGWGSEDDVSDTNAGSCTSRCTEYVATRAEERRNGGTARVAAYGVYTPTMC